jgi:hypothetical protein
MQQGESRSEEGAMQQTGMPQSEMERRRAMRGRLFAPRRMMSCPMCGWTGYGMHHAGHRKSMVHMTPLGMMLVSVVPVLVGFMAGFLLASARQR